MKGTVHGSRQLLRPNQLCHGCEMRRKVGEPRPVDSWPQRLTLTREQVDLLLTAAAEFEEMAEDAQTVSNAVDFVDWVSVDALRSGGGSPVVAVPHSERRTA